jgi:hypothetical protein
VKAALALGGVVALVAGWPPPAARAAAARAGAVGRLLAGAAGVLAALLGALAAIGGGAALRGLYRDVVRGSLAFVDFGKTWPVFGSEIGVYAAAALGIGLVLRVRGRAIVGHPVHGALILPTVVPAVVLALPRTPAVYQHAWLPVLPVVAIYAGLALATLGEAAHRVPSRGRRALALAAVAAAVAVPAAETAVFAVRDQNSGDLRVMRSELRLACPGEPVLDGTALAVFRPATYRYGALIRGIREWVARGAIPEEVIADDMRAARAGVAHDDFRIRGMIGPVADLLRRHYVAGPDGLLVPGADVRAEEGGGRAMVDVLVPGPYLVAFPAGLELAIDGAPVRRGWRTLDPGPHELVWSRLTRATCPERRVLKGRGKARGVSRP